jgi:hypothetical protein
VTTSADGAALAGSRPIMKITGLRGGAAAAAQPAPQSRLHAAQPGDLHDGPGAGERRARVTTSADGAALAGSRPIMKITGLRGM